MLPRGSSRPTTFDTDEREPSSPRGLASWEENTRSRDRRLVCMYARVVKCLHVYRDEIQNLLREAAQKIITWPNRTCSFEDSKFSSSISAWIAFYHEKKIILDLFFAVIFDRSNFAQKRISHCLNFAMKNRLRSTFERILLRIDMLYHFKDANIVKCRLSVSLRYAFYILEK